MTRLLHELPKVTSDSASHSGFNIRHDNLVLDEAGSVYEILTFVDIFGRRVDQPRID